ncbi:MAG: hypothetical protein Q8S15_00970 [Erysipelotrichaceae bacterium]|nr:hypothetical protein [Erysipelotrichaceae bacterium]
MVLNSAISYIKDNFHCDVVLKESVWVKKLPIYLSKGYEFLEVEIFNSIFILIDCSRKSNLSAEIYQKHIQNIERIVDKDNDISYILVFGSISNYLRMQLIKAKLSFVSIGKQIYIPKLGKVFSERRELRYANSNDESIIKMSPSTQALFLELLITRDFSKSMEQSAKRLDMTKMTVSRAYAELKILGLVKYDKSNKSSKYKFFSTEEETWKKAQSFLINPLLRKVYFKSDILENAVIEKLLVAGESALTQYSMLAHPENVEYGITSKQYKLISNEIEEIPIKDSNSSTIYIFKHRMPHNEKLLHPLAIALMFKEEIDERIQGEIENMMITYNWKSK